MKPIKTILCTCILIFLFTIKLYSSEAIIIDEKTSLVDFTPDLEYIEDKNNNFTLDIIKNKISWEKLDKRNVNFGYTLSPYWFKITINNKLTLKKKFFLEIDFPTLDHVDLYIPEAGGKYLIKKSGDLLPFKTRDIKDRSFIFIINPIKGTSNYYLRIKTTGSLNFFSTLMTPGAYMDRNKIILPLIWIFVGMIILITFYNLVIYFFTREVTYLYFVITTFIITVHHFVIRGLAQQYLWPDSTTWNSKLVPILLGQVLFWGGLFFRSYMEMNIKYSRFNKVYWIIVIIPGLAISIISFPLDVYLSIQTVLIAFILSSTLTLLFIIYSVIQKDIAGRNLLIGFAFGLIIIFIASMSLLGILPLNIFTRYGTDIGVAWVMVFFSLALANKINTLKDNLAISEKELRNKYEELQTANEKTNEVLDKLWETQDKLIMHEKKAVIGEMVSGLAHEIKNQLTPIESLTFIIDDIKDEDKKFIGYILDSRDRINDLVNEVKNLAKNEEPNYTFETMNLNSIISEAVSIARMNKKIKYINIDIESNSEINVMINKNKIIQVMLNLVLNAADAINLEKNGAITIKAENNNTNALVHITDNGKGISDKELEKIWEPFYTTKGSSGTGVGLDISRRIINGHNGEIWCDSKIDAGTTFTFSLPLSS